MNIIIPMAGMGKRMRPHTLTTPKPLVPIAGKPMVHRIVEDIANTTNQKIEHIGFVVGRFGEEAENSLLEVAKQFGAIGKIYYQDTPLGTADAILRAQELLQGNVFVAFADTLFKATFHLDDSKDAIIWTQKIPDPSAFGVVELNEKGLVTGFVEKPQTFVSDLAIIGVYYFKDGANLKEELQYLLDNNIQVKGEYQITDAMQHMIQKGVQFYTGEVEEWLDCGNKDSTLNTLERILEIKKNTETLIATNSTITNSTIIEPCYIGANVQILNSVIGPHASIESNATITNSIISKSIIGKHTLVNNSILHNSMFGNYASYSSKQDEISISDYSTKQ